MKTLIRISEKKSLYFIALNICLISLSCTTSEINPIEPPEPPSYTKVPHPEGMDISDLKKIFFDPSFPKNLDFSKTCDLNFRQLIGITVSKDEQEQGIRELVRNEPVFYHWCFYKKLDDLEDSLKKASFVDEKQQNLLYTYEFLSPIARAFIQEYQDTRYFRWAIARYQKLSEWIFFRPLVLTPEGTSDLVQPENPFGLWRKDVTQMPILEKYHINSVLPIPVQSSVPVVIPQVSSLPINLTPEPIPTSTPLIDEKKSTIPLQSNLPQQSQPTPQMQTLDSDQKVSSTQPTSSIPLELNQLSSNPPPKEQSQFIDPLPL